MVLTPDCGMGESKGSVGIVGLGLIGGSLGLDLRALGWSVQGLVHRTATVERALERGLVDAVSTDPACLSSCDLVILSLPIPALLAPESTLLEAIPESAVVTDVGSVKQPVLEVWRSLHPRFVASHPMAGTASAGVEAGQTGLFRGRPWIVTPEAGTDPTAVEVVRTLAHDLGSQWHTASAEHLLEQSRRLVLGRTGLTIVLLDDPALRRTLTAGLAAEFGMRVQEQCTTPEANGVISCSWSWWLEHQERLPEPDQVIVGLLPIASLSDPLTAARVERLKRLGNDWFRSLLLPEALRLIPAALAPLRRSGGRLAVLDGRLRGRSWGDQVLQRLEPWQPLQRLLPN